MLGPYHKHIYQPLDSQKREARFLKILPALSNTSITPEIRCSLHVESVDSDIVFEAISYCWGDARDTKSILLDREPFAVTRNAFKALETLSAKYADLPYVWIDAVCIRQDDTLEKNHQVPLMSAVYRQAKRVHIWLAPTIPSDQLLRATLDRVSAGETLESISEDPGYITMHNEILSSPWWDRVWVVQEALLASEALFHIGQITIDWNVMKRSCEHYFKTIFTGAEYQGVSQSMDAVMPNISHFNFNRINIFGFKDFGNTGSTLKLLEYMKLKSVTNERDRVYGILGLLPLELGIQPDYGLSVATIHQDFASRYITQSQNLDLLQLCDNHAHYWPSWVPRFSATASMRTIGGGASRGASCLVATRDTSLVVRAHLLGKISAAGEITKVMKMPVTNYDDEREQFRQHLANWRWLIWSAHDTEERRRMKSFQFWTMLLSQTYEMFDSLNEARPYANLLELDAWLEKGQVGLSPKTETLIPVLEWLSGSVFFVLESGVMGLSHRSPAIGDYVAILAGCDKPLLLRAHDERSNTFTLIHVCYCSGAMDGEGNHYAARRKIGRLSQPPAEKDIEDFLSTIRSLYVPYIGAELWVRDIARAKSILRSGVEAKGKLAHANAFSQEYREAWTSLKEFSIEWSADIFDNWIHAPFGTSLPKYLFETALLEDEPRGSVAGGSLGLAFICTIEQMSLLPSHSGKLKDQLDRQDVRDVALRLGSLIFEGFVRIESARDCENMEGDSKHALLAFEKGLWGGVEGVSKSAASLEWLHALQSAAKQYVYVERNVDVVFKEILLA